MYRRRSYLYWGLSLLCCLLFLTFAKLNIARAEDASTQAVSAPDASSACSPLLLLGTGKWVTMTNPGVGTVNVYLVDSFCRENLQASLGTGQSFRTYSYSNYVWRFRDAAGKLLVESNVTVDPYRVSPVSSLQSLKGVSIPEDSNIYNFIADKQAAKVLGKALFWDTAVGSDGQSACASCHFHTGADARTKNQLNPGANHIYQPSLAGSDTGPNYVMQAEDFPFFVLADKNDRNSAIVYESDDVMSSQGVISTRFKSAPSGASQDQCDIVFDNRFHVGGISTRKVEPRNTPTMINAVFNLRNFWDGRANVSFNGVNPFGTRDSGAGIYEKYQSGFLLWVTTNVHKINPNLHFSSLASQAVGPVLSDFEMACAGRTWPNAGQRLLSRKPLAGQLVAQNDSLLGSYRNSNGYGLNTTYRDLIAKAFKPNYVDDSMKVNIGGSNYSISEANFSFFFGLAVQLYEATLVSDNAPIDRYLSGDAYALTDQEKQGLEIFTGKGKCTSCHSGATLTNAGLPAIDDFKKGGIISYMKMGDSQAAIYDEGFYNIGVRPTSEDLGLGATDPFGNPLSFTRQYKAKLQNYFYSYPDQRLTVDTCTFEINRCLTPSKSVRDAVDGSFKVPTLRNVEYTGPYFHNGSRKSLEEVVEFYNRGGDRRGSNSNNSSGFGANPSNLDPDIQPLGLSVAEQDALVAFLKRPLTDMRTVCDQAPFDHPEITVANGHVGYIYDVVASSTGAALDDSFTVPAVGANGKCASDLTGRNLTFEEILWTGSITQRSNGENNLPAGLQLNSELNPSSPMPADLPMNEIPVESISIEGAAPIMLDEAVPVIVEEGEANNKLYLPIVTNQ